MDLLLLREFDLVVIFLLLYPISLFISNFPTGLLVQKSKRQSGLSDLGFLETFSNPYVTVCVFCKVCGKKQSLKHQTSWKRHFLTHSSAEEKPFKCEICGKSFVQSGNLKKHMLNLTGKKKILLRLFLSLNEKTNNHGELIETENVLFF